MYAIIGWFNVAAVIVMTAPFWLRVLNKHVFKTKSAVYAKLIKILRTIHKPLGITILVLAVIHGILALGALRLHTGTIAGTVLLTAVILGGLFYALKKKKILTAHRSAVLLLVVLILIHLIFPSAVYSLFGI